MKIIVVGNNSTLDATFSALNPSVEIIGVAYPLQKDVTTKLFWRDKQYLAFSQQNLKEFVEKNYYDYILVSDSSMSTGGGGQLDTVPESKIISLNSIVNREYLKNALLMNHVTKNISEYKLLVVGNSSTLFGIDLNGLNFPAINVSRQNQDLYYTRLWLEKMLSTKDNNFKYALIGISPYSFYYDLSLSEYSSDVLSYYPIFKDTHHFSMDNDSIRELFNESYLKILDNANDEIDPNNIFNEKQSKNSVIDIKVLYTARSSAEKWLHVDDSEIFEENVGIFTDCLKICRTHNVKPVVVVLPVEEPYRRYFPKYVLDEFTATLNKIQRKHSFQLLDFFNLNLPLHFFNNLETMNVYGSNRISKRIYNLFNKLDSKKIRIAFLMHSAPAWTHSALVFERLRARDDVDLYGLVLPPRIENGDNISRVDADKKYFYDLFANDERITLIDAETENQQFIDLEDYCFDYVFYPRPYNHVLPEIFSSARAAKFTKVCYIPYAFTCYDHFVHFYLGYFEFFQSLYFYFNDSNIYTNTFRQMYKTSFENSPQHFVFVGSAILEQDFNLFQNMKRDPAHEKITITWTPRWNYDPKFGGSHFIEYKDHVIEFRKKHPEINMIIRPHPLTFKTMIREKRMSAQEAEEYKQSLKNNNILLDETPSFEETFAKTDILLTDLSSIIPSYFTTGKPIIWCPYKVNLLEDFKRIESGMYVANNWSQIEQNLEMLLSGKDNLKDVRREIIDYLYKKHMGTTDRIVNLLVNDFYKQSTEVC